MLFHGTELRCTCVCLWGLGFVLFFGPNSSARISKTVDGYFRFLCTFCIAFYNLSTKWHSPSYEIPRWSSDLLTGFLRPAGDGPYMTMTSFLDEARLRQRKLVSKPDHTPVLRSVARYYICSGWLWFRTPWNRDVSNGPLVRSHGSHRSLTRSLRTARLARALRSFARYRARWTMEFWCPIFKVFWTQWGCKTRRDKYFSIYFGS